MERFYGIKKAYTKLPDAALYRIYEMYRNIYQNNKVPAITRIERFKALIPGLHDAHIGPCDQGRYSHRLYLNCKHPMVFMVHKDASGKVDRFMVTWYRCYKPFRDQSEHMWMSLEFHARTNVAHLNISTDMESHPTPMKKTWKLILSSTVSMLDRFFSTLNPQSIELHVKSCCNGNNNYTESYTTALISTTRLVDAVREAAKGKVVY
jgi:hypothetical protein